jgi:hypothetical protein
MLFKLHALLNKFQLPLPHPTVAMQTDRVQRRNLPDQLTPEMVRLLLKEMKLSAMKRNIITVSHARTAALCPI